MTMRGVEIENKRKKLLERRKELEERKKRIEKERSKDKLNDSSETAVSLPPISIPSSPCKTTK